MPFTGQLGESNSLLGGVALGVSQNFAPAPFGFQAHVLDSKTVRVLFNEPVSDTALNPGAYAFLSVSGPVPTFVPHAVSVAFYDSERRSVAITLDDPMTFSAIYSVTITGVTALNNDFITPASYNFRANVPDSPQPMDAFFTDRGQIDIKFDRSVGPTSPAVTAILQGAGGGSAPLHQIAWNASIPADHIRFQLDPGTPTDTSYLIVFSNVIGVSNNPGSGEVPLALTTRVSPYTYTILTDAYIVDAAVDSISNDPEGLNRALINVWFNCPMLGSDVTNIANWQALQQGAHPVVDTADNISIVPFDLISLISFCNQFKSQFNEHLTAANVHVQNAFPLPFASDVVRLLNNLRASFNAHLIASGVHLAVDTADKENLPLAIDIPSAILLVNDLKSKYNSHLVAGGIHVANDISYGIVTPDAIDLRTTSILADELAAKLTMHESSTTYHLISDIVDFPTAPFSNAAIVYPNATDLPSALGLLNEAQRKASAHYLNDRIHLYADTIHAQFPVTVGSQTVTLPFFASDQSTAIDIGVGMGAILNDHYLAEYNIPVLSVRDWASTSRTFEPVDSHTYLAQVEVPAVTSFPSYEVKVTIQSEDLARTTNPADFTGDAIVTSIDSAPKIISDFITPDQLLFRTDKGISIPELPFLSVTSIDGSLPLGDVNLSASVQTMVLALTDLMYSYQFHNIAPYEAGHKILDIVNVLVPGDFPSGSLGSLLVSLNRFRDVYLLHARSTTYHNVADPNLVTLPYATDAATAFRLLTALVDSFRNHNLNAGVHNSAGANIYSSKVDDTLVIDVPGMKELGAYTVSATVRNTFIDAKEGPRLRRFGLTAQFLGVAQPPYIASAIPKSGVVQTNEGIRFEQDAVILFFSKPIQRVPLAPITNVTITGPAGLNILGSSWIDDKVASLSVIGMTSANYTIDVLGIQDIFGNAIVSV